MGLPYSRANFLSSVGSMRRPRARPGLGVLAVPVAMQHSEVSDPGPHGLPVLMGESARDLVQVGEVVGHPGREQL